VFGVTEFRVFSDCASSDIFRLSASNFLNKKSSRFCGNFTFMSDYGAGIILFFPLILGAFSGMFKHFTAVADLVAFYAQYLPQSRKNLI